MTTLRTQGATGPPGSRALTAVPVRPVLAILVGLGALLTALSGRYGYHRDELYFWVAGEHPAWGYVDQPPLTPFLARVDPAVFGDNFVGLRVSATLLAVASVAILVLVARELGCGHRAQVLAAGCAAGSGIVLAYGHMLSTPSADLLLWLLFSLLTLRLLRTGDPRWFLPWDSCSTSDC